MIKHKYTYTYILYTNIYILLKNSYVLTFSKRIICEYWLIINNKYRNTDKIQYRVTDTNNMKTSLPDKKDLWKKV